MCCPSDTACAALADRLLSEHRGQLRSADVRYLLRFCRPWALPVVPSAASAASTEKPLGSGAVGTATDTLGPAKLNGMLLESSVAAAVEACRCLRRGCNASPAMIQTIGLSLWNNTATQEKTEHLQEIPTCRGRCQEHAPAAHAEPSNDAAATAMPSCGAEFDRSSKLVACCWTPGPRAPAASSWSLEVLADCARTTSSAGSGQHSSFADRCTLGSGAGGSVADGC